MELGSGICATILPYLKFTSKDGDDNNGGGGGEPQHGNTLYSWMILNLGNFISTASGALVVGGVRDIVCSSSIPGDRFECSME